MTNLELSRLDHREAYKNVYDIQAPTRVASISGHDAYYGTLRRLIERTVEPGSRILCIGSDIGQYLEWAKPSYGVGVEQSPALVAEAKRLHPEFTFLCQCFEEIVIDEEFDTILVINCVNDFFDVQEVATRLRTNCADHTKVIVVSSFLSG